MTSESNGNDTGNNCDALFDELRDIKSRFLYLMENDDKACAKNTGRGLHDNGIREHISRLRDIVSTIECMLGTSINSCTQLQ